MAHNRKLVIGGVALVKERIKNDVNALAEVRNEVETLLVESNYFASAPFKWIGLIIRYGLKDNFQPQYQKINKYHGDLPIAVEVNTQSLISAEYETIKQIFRHATIQALISVAEKYGLPSHELKVYGQTR